MRASSQEQQRSRGGYGPSPWRNLVPRALTYLGEVVECEIELDGERYEWVPDEEHDGAILACDASGRQMFILNPRGDAGAPRERELRRKQTIHVGELHERFTHRELDGYYNLEIPRARKPVFRGELVRINYLAVKNLDEDVRDEEIEWEHYFFEREVQGVPAYAELWFIGGGQYLIPEGPWKVSPEGIAWAEG